MKRSRSEWNPYSLDIQKDLAEAAYEAQASVGRQPATPTRPRSWTDTTDALWKMAEPTIEWAENQNLFHKVIDFVVYKIMPEQPGMSKDDLARLFKNHTAVRVASFLTNAALYATLSEQESAALKMIIMADSLIRLVDKLLKGSQGPKNPASKTEQL